MNSSLVCKRDCQQFANILMKDYTANNYRERLIQEYFIFRFKSWHSIMRLAWRLEKKRLKKTREISMFAGYEKSRGYVNIFMKNEGNALYIDFSTTMVKETNS